MKPSKIDFWGICCSGLCAIHCLLTPILLIFLPSLGHRFDNPIVHIVFFLAMFVLAAWTMLRHKHLYTSKWVQFFLVAGLIITFIGLAKDLPELFHDHGHSHSLQEEILFISGGVFLLIGHILNIKQLKCWQGHCKH